MMAWIRFGLTATLLTLALISMASAVLGNFRFGFIMNRIHAAGIGDTVGVFLAALAVAIGIGTPSVILKIAMVLIFMWCTSPVATHFLGQIEYYMDDTLDEHVRREDEDDDN